MNLILCVTELRPDVTWKDDMVNGFSLDTIAATYQSKDPLPSHQECLDIWPVIEAKRAKEIDDQRVKTELDVLDKKSIRDIREWIAKQPDAPATLKTYEAQAITERAKLAK